MPKNQRPTHQLIQLLDDAASAADMGGLLPDCRENVADMGYPYGHADHDQMVADMMASELEAAGITGIT